jgi:hypothetical protein
VFVHAVESLTTANAVGYTKIKLCAGQNLISYPFNASSGQSATINHIFPKGSLESGSYVTFFNPTDQNFIQYTNGPDGWYNNLEQSVGTSIVPRGSAFFVYSPVSTQIMLCGEVPGELDATNYLNISSGFQMASVAYPCSNIMTRTSFNFVDGDVILKYPNTSDGDYTPFFFMEGIGWGDQNLNISDFMVFEAFKGFWYISATEDNRTWIQLRPYSWSKPTP